MLSESDLDLPWTLFLFGPPAGGGGEGDIS